MAESTCSAKYGGCGRTFAGLAYFDMHFTPRNTCIDPTTLGLTTRQNAAGVSVWYNADAEAPQIARPVRDERFYSCRLCGGDFKGTGQRGRPPTTCNRPACGGKGIAV